MKYEQIIFFGIILIVAGEQKEKGMIVRQELKLDIKQHKVVLYSKTYCPFSKRIKAILGNYDIDDVKVIELDRLYDMPIMQDELKKISGIRTVPQLYIKGRFIGDQVKTKAMEKNGELEVIMSHAGIKRKKEQKKEDE